MKPLSMDMRKRAVALRREGHSVAEVSQRLMISKRSVERYWSYWQENQELPNDQRKGKPATKRASSNGSNSAKTLHCQSWRRFWRVSSARSVNRLFGDFFMPKDFPIKTIFAAEQDRPDVAEERKLWKKLQGDWDASRLAFIDETGLNTKMAALCGWAASSSRCVAAVPYGHWKSSTFIGALTLKGIKAPWLLDSTMNSQCFLVYLRSQLIPSLNPGDIVVCRQSIQSQDLGSQRNVGIQGDGTSLPPGLQSGSQSN